MKDKYLLLQVLFRDRPVLPKSLASIIFLFALFSFISFSSSVENTDAPVVSQNNGELFLPDGFQAVIVVDSLPGRARHLAVHHNGDVYVKLRFPDSVGGNVALRDTNGDGKSDIIEKFADYEDKGSYGTAMRIYNGYLYFSSELNVYRQRITEGSLVPQDKPELIVADDHPHGRHEHDAKPITFDDSGHIYVPFGAPSNTCQEQNRRPGSPGIPDCPLLKDHAGIWQFDAYKPGQTQKDGIRFATGLRSIVAMDWNSADQNLYCVMHGRDDLHLLWPELFSRWQSAVFPAEEFFKIQKGADAGWPYYYYDQIQKKKLLNPEYGGDGKKAGEGVKYTQPLIGFPAHWAPNDLFFYTGNQFPGRYKNGAFIAFHGSTNRGPYPQSGFFIGFVPFKKGKPSGSVEIFADGFAQVEPLISVSDAVYRPMGIAMGPDGSLYISDTEKGKIWKISYPGNKSAFRKAHLAGMEKRKLLPHIRTPHEIKDNLITGMATGGEKVYNTYCVSCHQLNGKGDGNRFPPLDSSEWVIGNKRGDKDKLIILLLQGLEGPIEVKGKPYNNTMPAHNFLSDEDAALVLTYIRNNFGNKGTAISAVDVNQVRRVLPSDESQKQK
ncbi:MAG: c-type cytochrome [Chitinophagaceae bacterium]